MWMCVGCQVRQSPAMSPIISVNWQREKRRVDICWGRHQVRQSPAMSPIINQCEMAEEGEEWIYVGGITKRGSLQPCCLLSG